jgi:hypothetical protein
LILASSNKVAAAAGMLAIMRRSTWKASVGTLRELPRPVLDKKAGKSGPRTALTSAVLAANSMRGCINHVPMYPMPHRQAFATDAQARASRRGMLRFRCALRALATRRQPPHNG